MVYNMKVTVCELSNAWSNSEEEKNRLNTHLESQKSDLLLLPEMPFYSWLAGSSKPNSEAWKKAVESHEIRMDRLAEFKVAAIAGSRPVLKDGIPLNEAFIWTHEEGLKEVHEKYYLPEEEGYWESSWYHRGNGEFNLVQINGINIGFLLCTEIWFNHHARDYGKNGIHLLLCPRATSSSTLGTWLAGGRVAAIVAGAYCVSSNFNGPNTPDINFGGTGWIIEPGEGNVMGMTSEKEPFLTLEIDLSLAEKAKDTYPRYVED